MLPKTPHFHTSIYLSIYFFFYERKNKFTYNISLLKRYYFVLNQNYNKAKTLNLRENSFKKETGIPKFHFFNNFCMFHFYGEKNGMYRDIVYNIQNEKKQLKVKSLTFLTKITFFFLFLRKKSYRNIS